jgi:integrase
MAPARPTWLADLSRSFKRHRQGRPGWFLEEHRDRLRLRSDELPPRPGRTSTRQAVTLTTPPGPATAAHALSEACAIFDAVMAGTWRWAERGGQEGGSNRLNRHNLTRLVGDLEKQLVGEKLAARTWQRMYLPFLAPLIEIAGAEAWQEDAPLLSATLRRWPANSRARQMGHDRIRRLWREAGWPWPEELALLRGNGKAAADPRGVRSITDQEIEQLREAIQASKLTAADLVAWDCLIVFGLRPQELIGLDLTGGAGEHPVAVVTRIKVSSKGATRPRQVPAVPPAGWPLDCHGLLGRWREHGLPPWSQTVASPGERMTKQLRRLQMPPDVSSYATRHAFALRLGIDLGLHVREAAELMGHSPQVHLQTYGRRLDTPKLHEKVQQLMQQKVLVNEQLEPFH